MPTAPSRPRMLWMDELRGLAVLLVVLHHVAAIPPLFGGDTVVWGGFMKALLPFRMPMLLVLSGILVPRSILKPMPVYYSGKLRNIVWPFILWTLITNLAVATPEKLLVPRTWFGGSYHTWFLTVLFGCYLVAPLTKWIPSWLFIPPMVLLSPVFDNSVIARLLWYGSFLFTGMAFAAYKDRWQHVRWFLPVGLLVFAVCFSAWTLTPGHEYEYKNVLSYLGSTAGVLGIMWLAPRVRRSHVLQRAGENSIVIYLAHFPVIGGVFLLLHPLIGSGWLLTTILLIVGFGVPWLMLRWRHTILFEWPRRRRVTG